MSASFLYLKWFICHFPYVLSLQYFQRMRGTKVCTFKSPIVQTNYKTWVTIWICFAVKLNIFCNNWIFKSYSEVVNFSHLLWFPQIESISSSYVETISGIIVPCISWKVQCATWFVQKQLITTVGRKFQTWYQRLVQQEPLYRKGSKTLTIVKIPKHDWSGEVPSLRAEGANSQFLVLPAHNEVPDERSCRFRDFALHQAVHLGNLDYMFPYKIRTEY